MLDNEKRLSIVLMQRKLSTDSTKFPENMIQNLNLDRFYQYNPFNKAHECHGRSHQSPPDTLSILTRAKACSCLKIGHGDLSPARAV